MQTCNIPGTTEKVLSLLDARPGLRILDLGCYKGDVSRELLRLGNQVSSCDLIAYEGTESLPDFRQVDANFPLPFGDQMFDAIISTDVIEHLENPTNLLRECSRILKPGGRLVLSTPNVGSVISRLVYAVSGDFPLFGEKHFREWNHISPVTAPWISRTGRKFDLRTEQVTTEDSTVGWKRRWLYRLSFPLFAPIVQRQPGALNKDHTLIVVLRRESPDARAERSVA